MTPPPTITIFAGIACRSSTSRLVRAKPDLRESAKPSMGGSAAEEPVAIEINGKTIYGKSGKDYYYPIVEAEREWIEIVATPLKKRDKSKKSKEIVGEFEIYLSKRLLFSGNLYKL